MRKIVFMTTLCLTAASAMAGGMTLRSGPVRTRLIELYSSEGCSSCPPADAWVSSLRSHARLWKDFVPVVFHVTYWDHLGWADPLADKAYTSRQRAYAASWGTETVYTPGWVLDGAEWRKWGVEPPAAGPRVGTLEAVEKEGRISARFSPAKDAGAYDLYAARLGFDLKSNVAHGENAGRRLRHDFIATAIASGRMRREKGAWIAEVSLPPARVRGTGEGLAVWVIGADGRPVQAVGAERP
jgi:hypothetical protein